ncbi:MAG: DUF4097 family beta strand repeat protein [Polyangiaceae bacterium]|nr:DUF4097 family beta strand repeat protein [Polyangiaceae bacterium]
MNTLFLNENGENRMPTFDTPQPISVHVELGVGAIRIAASNRSDTIVEVRPSNPASRADIAAATQTRVECANGRLIVKAAKGWWDFVAWGGRESIDIEIALPSGSRFEGKATMATLHCEGRLDDLRFKTGAGEIHVEHAGSAVVRTGAGNVNIERAAGRAEISTGTGLIEIGQVEGSATVQNANGDTWIGDVAGELRVNAANGEIAVDRAQSAAFVKTANGSIVLGEVACGEVVAETAFGRVDIGVVNGVPAWLELHTGCGKVRNELQAAAAPDASEEAVEIRARTGCGDIAIRRCLEPRAAAYR